MSGEVQIGDQENFLLQKSRDAVAELPGAVTILEVLRTVEMWH